MRFCLLIVIGTVLLCTLAQYAFLVCVVLPSHGAAALRRGRATGVRENLPDSNISVPFLCQFIMLGHHFI